MGSQTTTLSVQGMSCASCAARVERALQAAPGVEAAIVNLATERATITWTSPHQSVLSLSSIVTKAGYKAEPANDNSAASLEDRRVEDASQLKHQTLIAAILTLPVFVLEMGSHFVPGVAELVGTTLGHTNSWALQFVLITLVMIWPGRQFAAKGWPALLRGAPDMNSLVALGTAAAWAYSTVALFAPQLLPDTSRAVYFEAAGVIITLILLGRWFEARAKLRTGAAIRALLALQAKTATTFRDGDWIEIAQDMLAPDDLIRLRPGEKIATDGIVVTGQTWIDESMITGEPAPVRKQQGDLVTGGTLNGNGTLEFRATAVGENTVLAHILRMVEDAQAAKLPIQGVVDRIIRWFVPAVLLVATLTFIAWLTFGPAPSLSIALVTAVSVLIVACPCAMGLATPTSIMVACGRAAELGVLFRKGDVLQTLSEATLIAFDKTGTLTQGKPALTSIHPAGTMTSDDILQNAASLEALSEHPISQAITEAAATSGLSLSPVADFQSHTGKGLSGTLGDTHVLVGNAALMIAHNLDPEPLADTAQMLGQNAETPVFVAINGQIEALLGVSDPIKADAAQMISQLHSKGIRTAMITGDTEATAQAIAQKLGITTIRAGLLPAEKAATITALKSGKGTLVFVGDGINDAPALSSADIGIAVGTGTDVAIETADVVLISGALGGITKALAISHATMRNIRQNLFWAFAYNVALIPVAAGLLFPLMGTLLSPMLAAAAMGLSSLFVLSNALRLRRMKGTLS